MCLQTAIQAAGASRAVGMDDHVPDFSGKPQIVSAPELPVENEASSDSGAQS